MRPWRDATEYWYEGAFIKLSATFASMRPWRDATEYFSDSYQDVVRLLELQ